MRQFKFDKNGLHFSELTRLGMIHPVIFGLVCWMIKLNLKQWAIFTAQMFTK